MGWANDLEQDIDWRFAELAALKSQIALAATGSLLERALLRSILAMLYAHYEGFCKNALRIYLREIRQRGVSRSDCIDELAAFSLRKEMRVLRKSGDTDCYEYLSIGFRRAVATTVDFDVDRDGEFIVSGDSNMWANCLQANLDAVQLQCASLDGHTKEINSLVKRRNDIAHGKKLVVENLAQYQRLERVASDIIYELAYSIVDSIDTNAYLRDSGLAI